MEREEVIEKVSKALATKKIHSAFHPIIKEFFARAAEQYKWTEDDLQKALDSFKYLQDIRFKNMRGLEKGRNEIRNSKKAINVRIAIMIEYLKEILSYNVEKIEEFINVMGHELGHEVKIRDISDNNIESGLQIISKQSMKCIQGRIINEFAEIICAKKLQKGNFLDRKYDGYLHMQSAVRAAIYALGLTEDELFLLQWQGRKKYEEAVIEQLGELLGKVYIASFEVVLDAIHTNYMEGDKIGVIAQVKSFNGLVNSALKERFLMMKESATVYQLAKLDVEETICNEALQDMSRELRIEEKMKLGVRRDIIYNLSEDKMIASSAERILQEGDRILEERDAIRRKEARFYDNTQLIEEIYTSFLNYPIRLLPIAKIPEILRAKKVGKEVRKKQLSIHTEENASSIQGKLYATKHSQFVRKMVDLTKRNAVQLTDSAVPRQAREGIEHSREE